MKGVDKWSFLSVALPRHTFFVFHLHFKKDVGGDFKLQIAPVLKVLLFDWLVPDYQCTNFKTYNFDQQKG